MYSRASGVQPVLFSQIWLTCPWACRGGPIPQGDFYEDRGSSHCLESFVLSRQYAGSHIRSNTVYRGSGPIKEGEEFVVPRSPAHFLLRQVHFHTPPPHSICFMSSEIFVLLCLYFFWMVFVKQKESAFLCIFPLGCNSNLMAKQHIFVVNVLYFCVEMCNVKMLNAEVFFMLNYFGDGNLVNIKQLPFYS